MDAFEGIHTVCISSSPPAVSTPSSGYELLVTGSKGIALYSSHAFFGKEDSSGHRQSKHSRAKKEECPVGKLIDLDADLEPGTESGGGRGDTMLQEETETQRREAYSMSRLRSSSIEIREKGTEFLREQLDAAQKELKLKGEECERLSNVRIQLEQELEELTASLFEEAHKMVREANVKQATAEKQLKEAQGKIDVLQAEVSALKTLVLTSTPSSPNRQLHPQLLSPGSRGASSRPGGHTRTKSATLALPQLQSELPSENAHTSREEKELDSVLFAEFLSWREKPSLDRSSAFLTRIYREDIGPCLSFTCSELSKSVQSAVENNFLTIEPVALTAMSTHKASTVECGGPKKCALSGMSHLCRHRIKLGDKENYYYISPSSRARITAVCNFFTYIRYIQQGLVRHDAEQMFCEVMRLRREMSVAKLGFFFTDDN
ncbi:guanine nucleotide exchange factor for Rab-3A isoform X2 [Pangasianodon hypophthalmus]|uniref:guanine nucleotide exchange factor for Rab-3A isoform X2 n=1 Tax=Pangasianodon hypophthalmus TaxID=310915 RepID=UPI0023082CF9|nr:guanine nucleotide exchange factor for Rab-3A isoform X2 [Pangasianodon hypophthalmus]